MTVVLPSEPLGCYTRPMRRQIFLASGSCVVVAALGACGGSSTIDRTGAGGGGTTSTTTNTSMGTAGNTGTAGGGGTTSGQGGGTYTCDELEEAYAADIQSALVCDPDIDFEQCTLLLPGDLVCQCQVYVNPENVGEVNALQAYLDEYATLLCDPGLACSCAQPVSGSCEADSATGGECVTNF